MIMKIHKDVKTQLHKVRDILRSRYGVEGNIVTNKTKQTSPECQKAYDEGVMVGSFDGLSWALSRIEQESEEYLSEEAF
jgi:hypothetical protein|tara:strand:- start:2 stop:238 length:237 start_codon:yes stop_codon:yes gene_type:complete